MEHPMRYAVGRAESGCRYHVALPITDGLHEGVADFYGKIEAALATLPETLSSLVVEGRGWREGRVLSLRFDLLAYREGRVFDQAVRCQTWDTEQGVLLSPRDVGLILPHRPRREEGWYLDGKGGWLARCERLSEAERGMRRSELGRRITVLELAVAPVAMN